MEAEQEHLRVRTSQLWQHRECPEQHSLSVQKHVLFINYYSKSPKRYLRIIFFLRQTISMFLIDELCSNILKQQNDVKVEKQQNISGSSRKKASR